MVDVIIGIIVEMMMWVIVCRMDNYRHNHNSDNLLNITFLRHTTMKLSENFIEAIC